MTHIFLYGPPGAGKTSIGKVLARNLELPFIDLDLVIETYAGKPIPKIMDMQGESAFRDLETMALKEAINSEESVIALGGGSLLRAENRAMVENNGKVVLLMARLDTLLKRLNSDSNKRPLLMGDLSEKVPSLLVKRGEHYSSFPLMVHVDGKTTGQNTYRVQVALGRHHLSAMGQYDVIMQDNGIEQIGDLLYRRGLKNPIVVTDENVAKFQTGKVIGSMRNSGFDPNVIIVPAGEAIKTFDTISKLWLELIKNGLDRKGTIIALGGGVVGDMAGFAASTFMRGVSWVAVPTTLLSMVDASLGGKTGFDLPEGKNLIGSFYPPKLVLADPQVLETLPEVELISGLAEVVKHGIISSPELFNLCGNGLDLVKDHLEEIIREAMAVKIQIIEDDPYETGLRTALNLGHTVGHAVELASKFQLRHGEAVAIGMVTEAKLAERLSLAEEGLSLHIATVLAEMGLPVAIPDRLNRIAIRCAIGVDKKKERGRARFALPTRIGRVQIGIDVPDDVLASEI